MGMPWSVHTMYLVHICCSYCSIKFLLLLTPRVVLFLNTWCYAQVGTIIVSSCMMKQRLNLKDHVTQFQFYARARLHFYMFYMGLNQQQFSFHLPALASLDR